MAVYLQSTSEENLSLCISYGIWGANSNKISHWHTGDTMIAYVEKALAASFSITGECYYDETPVWQDKPYPYRIPLRLETLVPSDRRYSLQNADVRDVMFKYHTTGYGTAVVLNAQPLHENAARVLLGHIEQSPFRDESYSQNEYSALQSTEDTYQDNEGTPHTKIQFYLAHLGNAWGFDIWIPKNDQKRSYHGQALNEVSIPELPQLPFNDKVVRIISNIDVIWLQESSPSHLFEVEHSTRIYSGLLRMSDLVTMIPSLNIQMYICASSQRKNEVINEAHRPTFNRGSNPLSQYCRFISFEKLEEFFTTRQNELADFRSTVLDKRLSEPLTL